jgi:hypothetical protein
MVCALGLVALIVRTVALTVRTVALTVRTSALTVRTVALTVRTIGADVFVWGLGKAAFEAGEPVWEGFVNGGGQIGAAAGCAGVDARAVTRIYR